MTNKLKSLINWSNENAGFIALIIAIIGIFGFVFGNQLVGIICLLLLSISGIWYFFVDHLKKLNKLIIRALSIVSIGILLSLLVYKVYYSDPKIFNITKGFELVYQDEFIGGNLSNNPSFHWWNKDDQITNSHDKKVTLKSSSALHQVYPIFQNLKNLSKDHILLTKFYLPDGARISTQFMNTQGIDSELYLSYHLQECVLSSYKGNFNGDNYSKGYGEYLYERGPTGGSFNKTEVLPGIYYMLVYISSGKFSCYIQKEGIQDYITVIDNKDLKYTNLGGPAISRMIDGKGYLPKILDFKLYTRK